MADTVIRPTHGTPVMAAWFKKLGLSANGPKAGLAAMKRRCWWAKGVPAVDSGSQAAYPVQIGDPAFDNTNTDAYICTVAPAASTAATFVKCNA